ncbi:MAG TPA: hypothetical protein VMG59_09830 [Phycisphaerae bacterium]|nr:hypothetical protein [Phycisphaerae bacterium]
MLQKWLMVILTAVLISMINACSNQSNSTEPPAISICTPPIPEKIQTNLEFYSSDAQMVAAFDWAKRQALAYVFDGDPVGPWYEAALPGREAFCMRDTSHQAMGAQALGLGVYTQNMLYKFAENISNSKDWCSYWEINRYNYPAPVDYKNDAEFWYDLPANFDVLDCCYRMYLWTGDLSYTNNPVFQNFYRRTSIDYVNRWDLGADQVMTRERFINLRGTFNPNDKFEYYRGDPGYAEKKEPFVCGIDLLASQYAAYHAYAYFAAIRGDEQVAAEFTDKADAVRNLINTTWWDAKDNCYYGQLDANHQLTGSADASVLYYDATDNGPKAQAALASLISSIRKNPSSGVEGESHYAEILYHYGVPDVAYTEIMDLTQPGRFRQEYPEVSYSVIGAIVTGLMGVSLEPSFPSESALQGGYVEIIVKTFPALTSQTAWAQICHLPIRKNRVSVLHEGLGKTIFTNESGPALIWQAIFPGNYAKLLVNGKPVKAEHGLEPIGRVTSWISIPVGAGDSVCVQTPSS